MFTGWDVSGTEIINLLAMDAHAGGMLIVDLPMYSFTKLFKVMQYLFYMWKAVQIYKTYFVHIKKLPHLR